MPRPIKPKSQRRDRVKIGLDISPQVRDAFYDAVEARGYRLYEAVEEAMRRWVEEGPWPEKKSPSLS